MNALLIQLLKEEEGLTLAAKPDSKGYWAIGYGHDLPLSVSGYPGLIWTQQQADNQLILDAGYASKVAEDELPGYAHANEVQQVSLCSMVYQLGSLADWHGFRSALAAANFPAAAYNGLQSKWASQTPRRAYRESLMLATGVWIPK